MKILLINPLRIGFRFGENFEPLGLLYLAAIIREKSKDEVFLLDADFKFKTLDIRKKKDNEYLIKKCLNFIKKKSIDFVGIYSIFPTEKFLIDLSHAIKQLDKSIYVVAGGPHATLMDYRILKKSKVDYIVRGEGEQTIISLLEYIKRDKNLKSCNGISFINKDGKFIRGNEPKLTDIDKLPLPDRSLLPKGFFKKTKTAYVITSRGCPYKCSFCLSPLIWKYQRWRNLNNVIKEIKFLTDNYNIENLFFWDDTLLSNSQRAIKFCKMIIKEKLKIKMGCYARVEEVNSEICKFLFKSGFRKIKFGIESGNLSELKLLNKQSIYSKAYRAVRCAKKAGIFVHNSYQIGFPNTTNETCEQTLKFAKKINPNYAYFFLFVPYPGTPIYEKVKPYITSKKPSDYWLFSSVIKYKFLTKQEIYNWLYKMWYEFYRNHKGIEIEYKAIEDKKPTDIVNLINEIRKKIYSGEDKIDF
jgi:radical SAM superfamily enzyme YgiQ (UPF0313 family)